MELSKALDQRFSCRGFLDKPVSADQVRKLVETAQRVPSWGNTQPWKIYAAAGDVAAGIRRGLTEALLSGAPGSSDVPMPAGFEGVLMDRYRAVGKALFQQVGIGREDKQARIDHYARNFDAFGAPNLLYITVPKGQTPYVVFDAGAIVTALCLAATDMGLATCILAALATYAEPVRSGLSIPEDELIVIGVALGYADPDAPANGLRSTRAPLDEALTLSGF